VEHAIPYGALVFDFDGLVADTETPQYEAWVDVFTHFGAEEPLDQPTWQQAVGLTSLPFDPLTVLASRLAEPPDAASVRSTHRTYLDRRLGTVAVRPGVHRWLDDADAAGLLVAIASSSSRRWVEDHLERLGLAERFPVRVCGREGLAPKPAPDLYLRASEELAVEPAQCLALEDSPAGARAALAAGMTCVVVPSPMTAGLDFGAVHLVVDSLAYTSLADAVSRLHP
jgi:HAD superfamily hydrolase (TIGR01509 family)